MRSTLITAFALSAGLSSARLIQRQTNSTASGSSTDSAVEAYFNAVCLPYATDIQPDWNAPCWQVQIISDQCTFGSEATWNYTSSNGTHGGSSFDDPELPVRDQQTCACSSQFFNAINGCVSCANSHGLEGAVPNFPASAVSSFSSSYCAASNTATVGVISALDAAFSSAVESSYPILTATTYTDPIGSRTEVSLYFTPSVTGSAAYVVSQTAAGSTTGTPSGSVSGTASGQTVATSTRSGGAPGATGVEKIAAAGMLGLAVIAAAL